VRAASGRLKPDVKLFNAFVLDGREPNFSPGDPAVDPDDLSFGHKRLPVEPAYLPNLGLTILLYMEPKV
jgi:hypothetical protein